MPSIVSLASSFILILLILSSHTHATHLRLNISSLIPSDNCSIPMGSSSTDKNSLKLTHSHGPCHVHTTFKDHNINADLLLVDDNLRVAYLQRRIHGQPSDSQLLSPSEATLQIHRGFGNYYVTVGIGTPSADQTVVLDTGSDVCWIQCRPCGDCYPQTLPLFDPSSSSSFSNISCNSQACNKLSTKGCSDERSCQYRVGYGDGSVTEGLLVEETLTLSATDVFPNFVMGCGLDNTGLIQSQQTSGLFGLSRQSLSLISQISNRYGGVFSYCIPRLSSSTGELSFGTNGGDLSSVEYTPMLDDRRGHGLYFIELTGISVAGQRLPVSPSVFSAGGTIIDSGTVITRLPPSAYDAMRSAFRSGMTEYPLVDSSRLLDTCYDLAGRSEVMVPKVALHFGDEVTVQMDALGILYPVGESQVCLAFAANEDDSDVGIIGNQQQKTLRVVYDLEGSRVGFGQGSCAV